MVDCKSNVIPRAVSEHKFSSLCEPARGTLCFLCFRTQGPSPQLGRRAAHPRQCGREWGPDSAPSLTGTGFGMTTLHPGKAHVCNTLDEKCVAVPAKLDR